MKRTKAFGIKRACSMCGQRGHKATYNGKVLCPSAKASNDPSFVSKLLGKEPEPCTPFSSSAASPSALGSSEAPQAKASNLPPIDLTSVDTPNETTPEPEAEMPPSQQASQQQNPPPPSSPSQPTEAQKKVDAEQAGALVGEYWVGILKMGNAYVDAHQGFQLGPDLLKMNKAAMTHLATKWALQTDVNSDDIAAGVVIGSGAVVGGQSAWFAYKDMKKKGLKDERPVEQRATNPATGKPTPGGPVANGTSTGGPVALVPQSRQPIPGTDQYG